MHSLFQLDEFNQFIGTGRNLYLGFYSNKLVSISGNQSLISVKLQQNFEDIFHEIPELIEEKLKCINEQFCLTSIEIAGRFLEISMFFKNEYFFVQFSDITDFQRTENYLRESEERFRTLCDSSYEAIAILKDDIIIDCNQSLGKLLSMPTYEILGQKFINFIEKNKQKSINNNIRKANNKRLETTLIRSNLSKLAVELNIRFIQSDKKDIRVISLRDITQRLANEAAIKFQNQQLQASYAELKNIQNQLIQVEKVASLGTMAAGIAHEISQPLNALKITVDAMEFWFQKGRKQSPENIRRKILKIAEYANRITEIINLIRSIYQEDHSLEISEVNIIESLKKALQVLQSDSKNSHISIEYEIEDNLPKVKAHPIYVEQIFINIIRNAFNALFEVKNGKVEISLFLEENRVCIKISDNGPGLGDNPSRVFDPFFSLNHKIKGMGLGLALVRAIVIAWNGKITAYNRCESNKSVYQGAIFLIELPVSKEVF